MGLLKKKTKNKDERHNRKKGSLITAFDSMKYCTPRDGTEQSTLEICDLILDGYPVLANFNNVSDDEVNDMLAFISGVVYATYGELFQLNERLFLFGNKEVYDDGTLHQYVEDTK